MARLYALHDYDENLKRQGAFEIRLEDVQRLNKLGYGIHHLVNNFKGERKATNCIKINYWIADIDDGTKEKMLENINCLPLKPTIVVETKKGFHCYWRAIDATAENYKEIEKGLIKRLNADVHCTDVCRLLRFPTTFHMKDPSTPFKVKVIQFNKQAFYEKEMLCTYKLPQKPRVHACQFGNKNDFVDEKNWERLFKVSQIVEGGRNAIFAKYVLWLKDLGLPNQQIDFIINGINSRISQPLSQYEINTILHSKGVTL